MKEARRYRIKAFLWDQLIRPIHIMGSSSILKIFLLVFLFVAIIIQLNIIVVYTIGLILLLIFFYEIYKYYQSGEFMHNYRKYKYPDYKKATKVFKKEAKTETQSLNTLNNLNTHEKTNEGKILEGMGTYSGQT